MNSVFSMDRLLVIAFADGYSGKYTGNLTVNYMTAFSGGTAVGSSNYSGFRMG